MKLQFTTSLIGTFFRQEERSFLNELINSVNSLYDSIDEINTHVVIQAYAGMYAYSKSIPLNIDTVNKYHAVHEVTLSDITQGSLHNWSFNKGRNVDANIISEANNSGKLQIVTSSTHSLTTGDIVVITNANNTAHNKATKVTVNDTTTFTCDNIDYVANAGTSNANVDEPAYLKALSTSDGKYSVSFSMSGSANTANKTFKFEVVKNESGQDNIVVEKNFPATEINTASSSGIVDIVEGDRLWMAAMNLTDTVDFTIKHFNLNLHKL